MPPSPGKIQDLPVKILYNIDTSSQSYMTVLPERQPVFVHSVAPAQSQDEAGLGSCYLKSAVRGICFASPECIPNSSSLDFSVYNLDPSLRNRPARAFPPAAQASLVLDDSWTGKGFLSWILTELGTGKTLIKGRLVRDLDFSSSSFNEQGGLEGLVAAASSRVGHGQRDDLDGRGWGLEVCLSLKMINPDGKDEYKGRREFEEMLRRGTGMSSVTTVAAQAGIASSPASIAASTPRAVPPTGEPIRRNPPSAQRTNTMPHLHHSTSNLSTHSTRPSPAYQAAHLPPPPRPAASSSRASTNSSLPPSSLPMQASSSNGAGSLPPPPPRHSVSAPVSAPQPRNNGHSSSIPPASSSTHVASSSRLPSREVTPPPLAQRKSPPPTTPTRERLAALIRSDEKMSPNMAKQLAQNPVLLKLLKAVPPGAFNFSQNGESSKHSPDSEGAPTPTPSGPPGSSSKAGNAVTDPAEGCCNCGAMTTDIWRTKNMKDGTKKKVCNACGLYFNKHKRMRPSELWGASGSTADEGHWDKRPRLEEAHQPVRCSPRLHRNVSDQHHPPPAPSVAESPRKRKMTKPIPQPSPRMATRSSTRHDGSIDFGSMEGKRLDFSDALFSPSTMFGTSPAQPLPNPGLGVDMNASGSGSTMGNGMALENPFGDGDLDIEALLNQIAAADGTNGFSLEAFFANTTDTSGNANGNGNGMEGMNMMDMVNGWGDGTMNQGSNGNANGGHGL